jgi:hypothetical protein
MEISSCHSLVGYEIGDLLADETSTRGLLDQGGPERGYTSGHASKSWKIAGCRAR